MLTFEYRCLVPGQDGLNALGAEGFRLAFVNENGAIMERIVETEEKQAEPPAVERITPAGEGLDEYTCGCGCGEIAAVPATMRAEIVQNQLVPFLPGHGPHPDERTTYLSKKTE